MFYVYILASESKKYIYIGLTEDLARRLAEHERGKNKTTKAYRPFRLIHTEVFDTRVRARLREKYFKSGCGKEWIKINLL